MADTIKKDGTKCNMTVILDDEVHEIVITESQTILDAALDASLDAPYSCEGGFCTACRAKLTEGKAVMENNETLDEDEVAEGWILTCVAKPTTDKLIVNFDL
jgi:ring-1,2-phenylacetyl-CoA epoxidase subunit PaaE